MKHCENCIHFKPDKKFGKVGWPWNRRWSKQAKLYAECDANFRSDGERILNEPVVEYQTCLIARTFDDICGEDAKHYEEASQ